VRLRAQSGSGSHGRPGGGSRSGDSPLLRPGGPVMPGPSSSSCVETWGDQRCPELRMNTISAEPIRMLSLTCFEMRGPLRTDDSRPPGAGFLAAETIANPIDADGPPPSCTAPSHAPSCACAVQCEMLVRSLLRGRFFFWLARCALVACRAWPACRPALRWCPNAEPEARRHPAHPAVARTRSRSRLRRSNSGSSGLGRRSHRGYR
jgi:hypothetical protein